ncbi:MAG: hypothetical protein QOH05_2322 [Acetobacteraceae bacterium]|nr:hypothetical protein [Acetobacteraceae bacterium]
MNWRPLLSRMVRPPRPFRFFAATTPTARRGIRPLVAIGAIVGLAVALGGGALVSYLHARALADAERELSNIALVLASDAESNFRGFELLQTGIVEMLGNEDIQTVKQFDERLALRDVHENLKARIAAMPFVEAIFLTDAEGRSIASSRVWPLFDISIANREYFLAIKDDPARTNFLGRPARSVVSGTWGVSLSRRISAKDGSFLGIVAVIVDLQKLQQFLSGIALGKGSSISLWRSDGILLARFPAIQGEVGRSEAEPRPFQRILVSGDSGTITAPSSLDGAARLIAARAVANYPVVATVTRTMPEVLALWRRQAVAALAAVLVLEAVILTIVLLRVRQLRAQETLEKADAARIDAEAHLAVAQERERGQQERLVHQLRLAAALDGMSQGLAMFDAENRLIVANGKVHTMFGLAADAVAPGAAFDGLMHLAVTKGNLAGEPAEEMLARVMTYLASGKPASYLRELGDGRNMSICLGPMAGGGWLVTFEDITERRQVEAKIAYMAHHDALTGLPNRVLFRIRLDEALVRMRRGGTCALLCLDLDQFKEINDTLGHPVGDLLLHAVAGRVRAEIRDSDVVARLGGDEFAVVLSGFPRRIDARSVAERLLNVLRLPFEIEGHAIIIGASIGISVPPADGLDPDQLLKNADLALNRAKADGRNCYRFFEPEMNARMQVRQTLAVDLRRAIAAEEFELFYQPVVQIPTRRVTGFEALLRWNHPEQGLVPPDHFIPMAEETGLIVPIGMWVLKQACIQAAAWAGDLKVAVNLSAVQFVSQDLVEVVSAALEQSGLDPGRLELEITERVMLQNSEATLAILHALKALGVRIAMDDFGTGYSSLGYLQHFPFDRVKIDKSFINRLGETKVNLAIVRAVTGLCAALGMSTTAEGVETEDQFAILAANGCYEAQGYLFSRPCPVQDVPALLKRLHQWTEEPATCDANAG